MWCLAHYTLLLPYICQPLLTFEAGRAVYMAEAASISTARGVRCAGARGSARARCVHPAAPRRRRPTPRTVSYFIASFLGNTIKY